ncbi:MAG TPA: FHA domain-containing protein [Acetobacteraceae bacterium]|nr:FHA domain-containing protein [Acetobacteraceae bacterium]
MQAERATIRFMAGYQAIWFRSFPDLSRRAQWHIASHLCTKARDGAPVGELSGMVKQLFLLDDATVRERLGEFYRLGLCSIDPPDRAVSARTIILPSEDLLTRFDAHLRELGQLLFSAVREYEPGLTGGPPASLDDATRRGLLRAVEACNAGCLAQLDAGFAAAGISVARRLEAKRHLLSPSHWLLVQMAVERWYGVSPQTDEGEGVLADDLAAELLKLLRQNFQTTRDHIGYLVQLGLLERCPGRALRVALAEGPGAALHRALGEASAELVEVARAIAVPDDPLERTAMAVPPGPLNGGLRHVLTVTRPGEQERQLVLGHEPLVIGRAPSSGLMLPATEVSRSHCRLELAGGQVKLTDLESTNGTFVDGQRLSGSTGLQPGAVLQVGPYRLIYAADEVEEAEGTLRSGRPPSNVTRLRRGAR